MKSNFLSILIAIAVIAIGAYFLGSQNGKNALNEFRKEYTEFRQQAQESRTYLEAEIDSVTAEADSKTEKIESLTSEVVRLNRNRGVLNRELNDLDDRVEDLSSITKSLDTLNYCLTVVWPSNTYQCSVASEDGLVDRIKGAFQIRDSVIDLQKSALAVADSQLAVSENRFMEQIQQTALLRSALSLSNQRADSLSRVIGNMPPPPKPNRIFGIIPAPSKTVIAVASLAAGVYLGSELTKPRGN